MNGVKGMGTRVKGQQNCVVKEIGYGVGSSFIIMPNDAAIAHSSCIFSLRVFGVVKSKMQ